MRDKRFIAVHRGGSLTKDHHRHRLLIKWAIECSEHALSLIDGNIDTRLVRALHVAKQWENGNATAGDAMKASLDAHALARESSSPISIAIARSIGQAVATAHMADHSLGAALYALKAIKIAGKSIDAEKNWQNEKLPSEIMELVLTAMKMKEKSLKIQ